MTDGNEDLEEETFVPIGSSSSSANAGPIDPTQPRAVVDNDIRASFLEDDNQDSDLVIERDSRLIDVLCKALPLLHSILERFPVISFDKAVLDGVRRLFIKVMNEIIEAYKPVNGVVNEEAKLLGWKKFILLSYIFFTVDNKAVQLEYIKMLEDPERDGWAEITLDSLLTSHNLVLGEVHRKVGRPSVHSNPTAMPEIVEESTEHNLLGPHKRVSKLVAEGCLSKANAKLLDKSEGLLDPSFRNVIRLLVSKHPSMDQAACVAQRHVKERRDSAEYNKQVYVCTSDQVRTSIASMVRNKKPGVDFFAVEHLQLLSGTLFSNYKGKKDAERRAELDNSDEKKFVEGYKALVNFMLAGAVPREEVVEFF